MSGINWSGSVFGHCGNSLNFQDLFDSLIHAHIWVGTYLSMGWGQIPVQPVHYRADTHRQTNSQSHSYLPGIKSFNLPDLLVCGLWEETGALRGNRMCHPKYV